MALDKKVAINYW